MLDLIVCGVLIAASAWCARCLQPDFPNSALYASIITGAGCVLCGMCRLRSRAWRVVAMLSLVVAGGSLGIQALQFWTASPEAESEARLSATFLTVLVVVTLGTLVKAVRFEKRWIRETRTGMISVGLPPRKHG